MFIVALVMESYRACHESGKPVYYSERTGIARYADITLEDFFATIKVVKEMEHAKLYSINQ